MTSNPADAGGGADPFSDVTYDIREDEEQYVKLAEIVDLLVAAGYFRARIKGLPAFDKVIGGMVWCITQCSVDVDVDLLYHENSTIGQKILLTEKIVRALPKLKCPHPIQPHQIQGLDFIHIFPVIQWLVKTVMEHQADTVDQNLAQGVWQFDSRQNQYPTTIKSKAIGKTVQTQQQLHERAVPTRLFKRNPDFHLDNQVDRVQCTLLEYGNSTETKSVDPTEPTKSEAVEAKKKPLVVNKPAIATKPKADLVGAMGQAPSSRVNPSLLAHMSSTAGGGNVRQVHVDTPNRAQPVPTIELTSNVEKQSELAECEQQIEAAQQLIERLNEAINKEKLLHAQADEQLNAVKEEAAHFQQLETATDPKVLEELRSLMNIHDDVKRKEAEFKHNCQVESEKLETEIAQLRSIAEGTVDVASSDLANQHAASEQQLAAARLELAAINKQIASLQRHIDQIPSQIELNQYQRRFIELYNQMAAKHGETKQYYALHNTLLDVKAYMLQEINLLESIYGVHSLASNAAYKASFIDNINRVHDSVRQNKLKLEKKQTEVNMKRDACRDDLKEVQDKQRLYYKTVNDFQAEMKRNEQLTAQLADLKKQRGITD